MRIPFFASATIGLLSLAALQAHAGSPEIIQLHHIEAEQSKSVADNLNYFIQPSIQSDFQYFRKNSDTDTLDIGINFNNISITANILNISTQNTADQMNDLDFRLPNVAFNYNFGQGNISLGYGAEKLENNSLPLITSYNTNIDVEYRISDGFDIYTSLQLSDFDEQNLSSNFENNAALILGTSVSF